jgi:hypothetical protein
MDRMRFPSNVKPLRWWFRFLKPPLLVHHRFHLGK